MKALPHAQVPTLADRLGNALVDYATRYRQSRRLRRHLDAAMVILQTHG